MNSTPKGRVEEIRERLEKATPGPWIDEGYGYLRSASPEVPISGSRICEVIRNHEGNGPFIAHTRADMDYLLEINADLLAALEDSQDMLFGVLDYFEPGQELNAINRQRDKNAAAIARAKGQSQ